MNLKNIKGNAFLLIATIIWGSTFVAQDIAADIIGPFEFHSVRTFIGALVLIPVILFMDLAKKKSGTYVAPTKKSNKDLIIGGALCGLAHCIAACLQQIGMSQGTESGKAGFITAMYIIFVPVLGIFLKKKIQPHIFICIALSVAGLYLLCIKNGFSIRYSDFIVLLCAITFAFHILLIDRYVERVDCVKLSFMQFVFSALLSSVFTLILENGFHFDLIIKAIGPILYAGVLSCGVAYTFQILGQKNSSSPTVASLIMSFESVVAVISEMLVLKNIMSTRETIGSLLMFTAIILSQIEIPNIIKNKRAES